ESGAFIASPSFPTYHYARLRDGAFCAHALDLFDETDAAAAFHRWVSRSIEAHRPLIERAITAIDAGVPPPAGEMPPARYTLDGPAWGIEADRLRSWLLERFLRDGRFMRGATDERVDGSLLWLGVPFSVLPIDDPRMEATVEAVRRDLLRPGGGVYRYLGDTY